MSGVRLPTAGHGGTQPPASYGANISFAYPLYEFSGPAGGTLSYSIVTTPKNAEVGIALGTSATVAPSPSDFVPTRISVPEMGVHYGYLTLSTEGTFYPWASMSNPLSLAVGAKLTVTGTV